MNKELELRILDVKVEDVIKKLEDLGANKVGDWFYKRIIYDTKPIDEDKWIRLRTDGELTTLTYKNFNNASIDGVDELEIEVSDFKKTEEILKILGYIPRSYQENKRIRYIYNDTEIDIDTWPHLNTYVEVEGKSEEDVNRVIDILKEYGSEVTGKNVQSIYKDNGYDKESLNDLRF